ncbi:hypothetical protein HDK90DRAFT_524230 [Phyllosticta capitalensis]|uniref:Uncharacterized protein n=1 Tax=Phyllosticta capitalensis TaxID=121624 RepID=A0ABR1YSU1_9PEZI
MNNNNGLPRRPPTPADFNANNSGNSRNVPNAPTLHYTPHPAYGRQLTPYEYKNRQSNHFGCYGTQGDITPPGQFREPVESRRVDSPVSGQEPKLKENPDDVDGLIKEECAKARAKAAIAARKSHNRTISATTFSEAEDYGASSPESGEIIEHHRKHDGHTKNVTERSTKTDRTIGSSVFASSPPSTLNALSGKHESTSEHFTVPAHSSKEVDAKRRDLDDWLALTGFHDKELREARLASYRQVRESIVSGTDVGPRPASGFQRHVREASSNVRLDEDTTYKHKIKEMAEKFRADLPPELIMELAASQPTNDNFSRTADAREEQASMAFRSGERSTAGRNDDQAVRHGRERAGNPPGRTEYHLSRSPRRRVQTMGEVGPHHNRSSSSPRRQHGDENHYRSREMSGRRARRRRSLEAIYGSNRRRRVDKWRSGRPDDTRP